MSKDRLIQSIALAANCVTILGLLLVIFQLQQNRSLMRAQVRHELVSTIVDRPVYAHVAKHNFASIRVLQKCGFQLALEDMCDGEDKLVMELRSDRCATAANKPTKT